MLNPSQKISTAYREGKTLLYWKSSHSFSLLIRAAFLKEAFPTDAFGRFSRKAKLIPYNKNGRSGLLVLFDNKPEAIKT
jgi:hypothetical protein